MLKGIKTFAVCLLLTCAYQAAYAAKAQVSSSTVLDFGTLVLPVSILSSTTITVSPTGKITTTGSYTQQTGGRPGSFTLKANDGSVAPSYAIAANTSHTNISLVGCSGGVLSTANIAGVALDSTGPKNTPNAKFNYGASITFTQLISGAGSLNCTVNTCASGNGFYYRLNDPPTSTNNDGQVQFCFTVKFRSAPINIMHRTGAALNFGKVCRPSGAIGTVTLSPLAVRTLSNIDCAFNTPTADIFDVTGVASTAFTVVLPSSVNINNGTNTLTLSNFTSSCTSCTLNAGGAGSFTTGATLSIPQSAQTGTYSGAYTVSIIY